MSGGMVQDNVGVDGLNAIILRKYKIQAHYLTKLLFAVISQGYLHRFITESWNHFYLENCDFSSKCKALQNLFPIQIKFDLIVYENSASWIDSHVAIIGKGKF